MIKHPSFISKGLFGLHPTTEVANAPEIALCRVSTSIVGLLALCPVHRRNCFVCHY